MGNLIRINQIIFDHRQKQLYEEALDVYKQQVHQQFSLDQIKQSDMLIANVLHCLRKTHRPELGLAFLNSTLALMPEREAHPATWAEYGWCLYFVIKGLNTEHLIEPVPRVLHEAVAFIQNIQLPQDYLIMNLLFLELSKKLMRKGAYGVLLLTLFSQLKAEWFKDCVENASDRPSSKVFKTAESASDLEVFLVRKSKALLLNGEFLQCIQACHAAFAKIGKFHNGNHIWLARTLAIALQQTGRPAEAIEKMKNLLLSKKDWFLHQELAGMYFQNNQQEQAVQHLVNAALIQGHTPYKAGLYEEMGIRYFSLFEEPLRCKILWLAAMTRKEQRWKLTPALNEHLQAYPYPQTTGSAKQLYAMLSKQWADLLQRQAATPTAKKQEGLLTHGHITRILNTGENGDGFITTHQGQGIYFRFKKTNMPPEEILQGTPIKVFARMRDYKGKSVYNALWVKRDHMGNSG